MALSSGLSIRSCAAAAAAAASTLTPTQAEHECTVQYEIEESERATIKTALDSRPVNTKRKYDRYQNKCVQWCSGRNFRDHDTVSGGKLHLFLSSTVIGRKSKKNKDKTMGGSTVCGNVNAIVNLYN
ncbi:hypothetical protein PC128_g3970 [Phytophthora cactorum]|nr:hypothetical protein PC128_g3970 [Phytophthora cactorum]KAG4060647.1 hypothetical protein PC123_g4463 [Phytophthora cactorum]